jgi:hypothetical protein
MSSISFDEYALNTWVEMCNKEKKMHDEGASESELRVMRVCVMAGMVHLLPNLTEVERDSLLAFLLQKENILPAEEASEDPGAE